MRVQLIDNRDSFIDAAAKNVTVNRFDAFDAFDQYDTTVICLQDSSLWKSAHRKNDISFYQNDFSTVARAMKATQSCKTLVLLPQNTSFSYNWISLSGGSGRYREHVPLKDMMPLLKSIIQGFFPSNIDLITGASETEVAGLALRADFSLAPVADSSYLSLLSSNASTITMLASGKTAYTTLSISNCSELKALVDAAFPAQAEEAYLPDWLEQIEFLDEGEIKRDIERANEQILSLEETVETKNQTLGNYNKIKSILCTNGDTLQETVVEMLQDLFGDNAEFVDDHKEDYRYEDEGFIYVFEVKGSKKGLKRQHVSDAFHHTQVAKDDLEDSGDARSVKGCLIFSEYIETPPGERDHYAEDTIAIAKQSEITLISATSFLRIYERIKEGDLTGGDFLRMIRGCAGELEVE